MKRGTKGMSILLLLINMAGIAGALAEVLLLNLRLDLNRPLFWGGLAVLSAVSILCRTAPGKGKIPVGALAVSAVYVAVCLLFRETVLNGLSWSLQRFQTALMEYYGVPFSFQHGMELLGRLGDRSAEAAVIRSVGVLAALTPLTLFTGLLFVRGRWQVFLLWDAVWFALACVTDVFPGIPILALCVTGIVLAAVAEEFRDSPGARRQALAGMLAVVALALALVGRFVLPVLNEQYDLRTELRHNVYVTVNYKWMPGVRNLLHGGGPGSGVDVTGAFGRQSRIPVSHAGVYWVALSGAPKRSLYLRGFVGADYGYREWTAEGETALREYYREKGYALQENGREILNIGYDAARGSGPLRQIEIRELFAPGSYSLLPYGALVTEEYAAHDSGILDRLGETYGFEYRETGRAKEDSAPESFPAVEGQYRRYVYDSFLDYPEERLPRLTEALREMDLSGENVYACAAAIIGFLGERTYRLDVPATPVGEDFVEYFLFEERAGYCAHFASSAVLMFRYCGIPARYATGYCASWQSFQEADGVYVAELGGNQAHAWAEIYVDGQGWVPVETTPGAAPFSGDNRGEMLLRLGLLTGDVAPSGGGSASEEDDEEEEEEEEEEDGRIGQTAFLPDQTREEEEDGGQESAQTPERWAASVSGWLLAAAVFAVLAAAGTGVVRRLLWGRRLKRTEGREKVFLLYRNMRNALHLMGCSRRLLLTGDAFWERLQKVLPSQDREGYDALCLIMERSAFGREAPTREETKVFGEMHDEMMERLYLRAPFYKRPAFAGLICCMPVDFRFFGHG